MTVSDKFDYAPTSSAHAAGGLGPTAAITSRLTGASPGSPAKNYSDRTFASVLRVQEADWYREKV